MLVRRIRCISHTGLPAEFLTTQLVLEEGIPLHGRIDAFGERRGACEVERLVRNRAARYAAEIDRLPELR